MRSTQLSDVDERFISWLEELSVKANDEKTTPQERSRARAALAAFRRGLGKPPGSAVEMLRYIPSYVYSGDRGVYMDIYLLIASLFASHPALGGTGSIGSTLAEVRAARDSNSIEARFVALLNCHDDELFKHLRYAIALAKSSKSRVPVNWRQLLADLKQWRRSKDQVRQRWARDFWGRSQADSQEEADEDQHIVVDNQ